MQSATMALWLSRSIRWALAAGAAYLAYSYNEPVLYGVAGVLFVTGFLKPKRCVEDCKIND